MFTIFGEAG